MADLLKPQDPSNESPKPDDGIEPPQRSEVDGVQAPGEVEKSAQKTESDGLPIAPPKQQPLSRAAEVIVYLSLGFAVCVLLGWGAHRAIARLISAVAATKAVNGGVATSQRADRIRQTEAEGLLRRLATGEQAAADQVLAQSDSWTGKTERTPKTDQWVDVAINLKDMHVRAAAVQAELALDGVPRDASGLKMLEDAADNPSNRAWALWLLGALGSRGVSPEHAAKVIGAYLDDPVAANRAAGVNGLALLATDETIPMLLDRFRNDPSPVVQERAACGLAEAGMYTHEQRMVAAASMVAWLDDSLLTAQQRTWMIQALRDISGQNFGTDAAAWRRWHDGAR